MKFRREWAMPSPDTLSIFPIACFVQRHIAGAKIIVDPFARNCMIGTHRNDLNPETLAQDHMDAVKWLEKLNSQNIRADAAIFDPPYSPRQVSEVYQSVGIRCGMEDTQTAKLYGRARTALDRIMKPGAVVLSFGWSSNGMGVKRRYKIEEILLVAHGGAHNDTICIAERKCAQDLFASAEEAA